MSDYEGCPCECHAMICASVDVLRLERRVEDHVLTGVRRRDRTTVLVAALRRAAGFLAATLLAADLRAFMIRNGVSIRNQPRSVCLLALDWSGRLDLNQRPPAPHAGTLPGCATPRRRRSIIARAHAQDVCGRIQRSASSTPWSSLRRSVEPTSPSPSVLRPVRAAPCHA